MTFAMLPRLIAAALLSTPLAGCMSTAMTNDVPRCEDLIPPGLLEETEPVPVPEDRQHKDGHQDALPWIEGYLGNTGQLQKANERPPAVDHIYRRCLELHRKALSRSRRFLGIF